MGSEMCIRDRVGTGQVVGHGFGGNGRIVTVAVERGRMETPGALRRDDEERDRVAR